MVFDRNSRPQPVIRTDVTATVKWFNPTKGFGFVTFDDGTPDAFCHISAVERAGYDSLPDGSTIVCDLSEGQRGQQVSAIHSVDTSTAEPSHSSGQHQGRSTSIYERPDSSPRYRRHDRGSTEIEGTVKFFNTSKGFGFIAPDTGGKDVFVHVSALSRSNIVGLDEGQRVRLTVRDGEQGPKADRVELA